MPWTRIVDALAQAGRTVVVAESFTGGRLAAALTSVPGASRVFLAGVIAYADDVKTSVLRIRRGTLAMHGAVSEPVAIEMAEGARRLCDASYALSTTGIAGPTGETPLKPVGLSIVGLAYPSAASVDRRVHLGRREQVQESAVHQARRVLEERLRWERIL